MTDMERVKIGLQCIIEGNIRCESCGYAIDKHGHHSCQQNCASEALDMLKEQEAVEPKVSSTEQRCGNCNKIIEMDGWKVCPWCGKRIDWEGWWKKNGTCN